MPTGLDDRAEEVLEPLFAIAELAGGAWLAHLRRATSLLMAQASDDDIKVLLLWNIHAVYLDQDINFITSADLVARLNQMNERPWLTCWKRGEPLTTHRLARMLKGFEVVPKPNAAASTRGYCWDSFEDAWSRHASPEAVKASECQYPNENGPRKPGRTDGLTLHPPRTEGRHRPLEWLYTRLPDQQSTACVGVTEGGGRPPRGHAPDARLLLSCGRRQRHPHA